MPSLFKDSPEYTKRTKTPFKPTEVTLSDVRANMPKYLFEKSTLRGILVTIRDVASAVLLFELARRIDSLAQVANAWGLIDPIVHALQLVLWLAYWFFQSVVFAGCWVLAHEAGHGTIASTPWINDLVGFTLHTFLLAPYFAWRTTHQSHHKATGSLERDENYVPRTRSYYLLPPESKAKIADYHDVFEEVPLYTLLRIVLMQAIGWQYYLLTNIMGNPSYPQGTNHFQPSSPLFKPHHRSKIIASNVGLGVMVILLAIWSHRIGFWNFIRLYFIPYILTNHWIVMITYLQHSDPTIPHYRNKEWTFLRGALSTVDRPFLGWMGRFFLHNVSHDHIAHHVFSTIPFYNLPHATKIIKSVLGDDYNYDSTNSFRALYRTFSQCCFIEDDGDIVFYKNKEGRAARILASDIQGD
ncbi:hypothetical protein MD484_g3491, partial [Candolleomyces efflorescens]